MRNNVLLALLFCALTAPCSASGGDVELSDEEMIDAVEAGEAIDSAPLTEYTSAIDSSMDDELVDMTTDEPESTVNTETSTTDVRSGTQSTDTSTRSSTSEPTKMSRTTAPSSSSTASSESSSSSSKSSSSTTAAADPQETLNTTQSSTTQSSTTQSSTTTTTALVEGSLSFEVTDGNASDIVDAFASDTNGTVAHALAIAIAAGADGVEAENVTILSVELENAASGRRLASAHLRSSRELQANAAVVVQYRIVVPAGADSAAVADALTSSNGAAAIQTALTTELRAVDPSLTVGSVQVEADVVVTTATTTLTLRETPSLAHRSTTSFGSIVMACSIASLLLQ